MRRWWSVVAVALAIGCGGVEDLDGDGFTAGVDCDDADATVFPGAEERCDEVDRDCDGDLTEGAVDAGTWYTDADLDGVGVDASAVIACERPEGAAAVGGDCDDTDPRYRPGAPEDDCTDPNDYNCDGSVGYADADADGFAACQDCDDADPGQFPGALWFPDEDGDGYGRPVVTQACARPEGFVASPDDCDDTDPEVNPETVWYPDLDGDGFGDAAAPQIACLPEGPAVLVGGDCDDSNAVVNPLTRWYRDADRDGYGSDEATLVQCAPPPGYTLQPGDCDDTRRAVHPERVWYRDADGDGEGTVADTLAACEQPEGYVRNWDDCDDGDARLNRNTPWYPDSDGDGFGAATPVTRCLAPEGFVGVDGDCDDAEPTTYPGADEQCDEHDHDCDGDDGLADCEDCAALLDAEPSLRDGFYTIDPDGRGGSAAFEAWCDMTTDGGGWTRFWWWDAGEPFRSVKDTLGSSLAGCDARRDGRCLATIPVADPEGLLVVDDGTTWASWSFDPAIDTSERVLDALTMAGPDAGACGDAWPADAWSSGASFCDDDGSGEVCACFAYESVGGVWSFALDDDLDAAGTAFGAGVDAAGDEGVDGLDGSSRGNGVRRSLELYWR